MIIKGYEIKAETVNEICRFSVLMALLEKNRYNYGKTKDYAAMSSEIDRLRLSSSKLDNAIRNLAIAINGKVEIYVGVNDDELEIFVEQTQYDLYVQNKSRSEMSENEKTQIDKFKDSQGSEATIGGLYAINRIRNNLFHGIKNIDSLNNQIDLFNAMNNFLEEIV